MRVRIILAGTGDVWDMPCECEYIGDVWDMPCEYIGDVWDILCNCKVKCLSCLLTMTRTSSHVNCDGMR